MNATTKTSQPEKVWRKPSRRLGADVVGRDACPRDPDAVGDDRHGDGGERQGHAGPGSAFDEVAVHDGERQQRDQRADAAARLGDFQCRVAEVDHVPFPQDRDAEGAQRQLAEARGEQLQGEGHLVEDDRRHRDHQQQEQQREREDAQVAPPAEEQDQAAQDAEHRDAGEEQLGAEGPGPEDRHAGQHDGEADGRRAGLDRREPVAALPRQVEGDRDDQEAVGVVLVNAPVVDQLGEDVPVEDRERHPHRRQGQGTEGKAGHTYIFGQFRTVLQGGDG